MQLLLFERSRPFEVPGPLFYKGTHSDSTQQKTKSTNSISVIDRMSNSKLRGKNVEKVPSTQHRFQSNQLKNRTQSDRPSLSQSRCNMKVHVLLSSKDNRFYLMSNSNLSHQYHHPIIPAAKVLSQKDVSNDEEAWIEQMFNMGLSNGTIAAIMTGYFNKTGRSGQFSVGGIK